jgi:transcriptional regulator with XRE-family HTH domain
VNGQELAILREDCGWSQAELAELLGRTRSSVFHWEHGRGKVPPPVAAAVRRACRKIRAARRAYELVRSTEAEKLPRYVIGRWEKPDGS